MKQDWRINYLMLNIMMAVLQCTDKVVMRISKSHARRVAHEIYIRTFWLLDIKGQMMNMVGIFYLETVHKQQLIKTVSHEEQLYFYK